MLDLPDDPDFRDGYTDLLQRVAQAAPRGYRFEVVRAVVLTLRADPDLRRRVAEGPERLL